MNFLVVGCGSIGARHIANVKRLGHRVWGCEQDHRRARAVSARQGIAVYPTLREACQRTYDAAFICTPTSSHIPIALQLARAGMHLFIEKPLSHTMQGISTLVRELRRGKLVGFVGCNMRFLPSVQRIKTLLKKRTIGHILAVRAARGFYLPYWRPHTDYRKQYSAARDLGGGVILDDIHDLDLLYWLFGHVTRVSCTAAKVSELAINTEDVAEITLRFATGVMAHLHLDYLQQVYRSAYEFIGTRGIIEWDYINDTIAVYRKQTRRWQRYRGSYQVAHDQPYIDEVKHFIRCIRNSKKTVANIVQARDVLSIALACHASAKKNRVVRL